MFLKTFLVLVLTAFPLISKSQAAQTAFQEKAEAFVQKKGEEAMRIFGMDDLLTRYEKMQELVKESFATDQVARFVMGAHWRKLSDSERNEFMRVFRDFTLVNYVQRNWDTDNMTFKVHRALPIEDSENQVLVQGTFSSKEDPKERDKPLEVEFRILNMDEEPKFFDIVFTGKSLNLTLRSQFSSLLNRNNGNVERLLMELDKAVSDFQTRLSREKRQRKKKESEPTD